MEDFENFVSLENLNSLKDQQVPDKNKIYYAYPTNIYLFQVNNVSWVLGSFWEYTYYW